MPKGRWSQPSEQRAGAWFAHVGVCQSQPESTTRSALKWIQNPGAAQYVDDRLPLAYRIREQRAVNNNFPFSSHDNRHCLQNVGEYFDSGMGRRKVKPESRQQNSQNFLQWAHESVPSGEDGLTIYQTSFVKDQNTESPFCRRYPKHHSEKWCTDKPVPEEKKHSQTSHLHYKSTFVALPYHQSLFSRSELLVTQMDDEIMDDEINIHAQ
ncbi:PREDICTED: testis-expressed sequence 36 protein [Tauraco erythrolophus]|uniref:testis-expressed sequence 36 protein n=1 Tax=Tauraco erythrolophus TaxID=121530 RepID=UPI0005238576|nr:PREDICTED: testis-expressed sequence 36 protein [Tauraco erythrolophus]